MPTIFRVTFLISLLSSLSLLIGVPQTLAQTPVSNSVIHYDFINPNTGRLDGGTVKVDKKNRFHARTRPIKIQSNSDGTTNATAPLAPITKIVDNGPSANRVDLVSVGDGYQSSQLGVYRDHVNLFLDHFFSEAPLNEYKNYFNFFRVDVVSTDSGVDNDPTQGIMRRTALDMHFWCDGIERLLCVDLNMATSYAQGAEGVDQILALANTETYGGAGYTSDDVGTFSGGNEWSREVALHELGHSFADLGDEYEYGGPPTYPHAESSYPNLSTQREDEMLRTQTKWFRWLDDSNVSTFESGEYSLFGVFRPTNDSKMKTLDRPFEQVNTEQIILNIYKLVKPIDEFTPEGRLDVNQSISIKPMRPLGRELLVQWYLNDELIENYSSTNINLAALNYRPSQINKIQVKVTDTTPLVRDENIRSRYMTQTKKWTVFAPASLNKAPLVNAGSDQKIILGNIVQLSGSATDDNLPVPSKLTFAWALVSGPSAVKFASPLQANTAVELSSLGTYVLRLTVNDGALSTSDDVTIVVEKSGRRRAVRR